jgi:hypothetical protein
LLHSSRSHPETNPARTLNIFVGEIDALARESGLLYHGRDDGRRDPGIAGQPAVPADPGMFSRLDLGFFTAPPAESKIQIPVMDLPGVSGNTPEIRVHLAVKGAKIDQPEIPGKVLRLYPGAITIRIIVSSKKPDALQTHAGNRFFRETGDGHPIQRIR